jgi:hypothetical protein
MNLGERLHREVMMRKRVFGAVVGGLGLAMGLGACVGQDPVVGENKASRE